MSEPSSPSRPSDPPFTSGTTSTFLNSPAVCDEIALTAGWEFVSAPLQSTPEQLTHLGFQPATVPGTVAQALRNQNRRLAEVSPGQFDESEYWFRLRFDAPPSQVGEEVVLRFGGIATVAEAWLNGELILRCNSMFAAHECNVTSLLRGHNELLIVCRSLKAALRERRTVKPYTRWRTRIVNQQQLRWFRTTLLGRAPGFAGELEPVGPWRPVELLRRRRFVLESCSVRAELNEPDGTVVAAAGSPAGSMRLDCVFRMLTPEPAPVSARFISERVEARVELSATDSLLRCRALLIFPTVDLWWPHTHGEPRLYPIQLRLRFADGSELDFDGAPVGFRSVTAPQQLDRDALPFRLSVNGEWIFARGVVWTPPDPLSLSASRAAIRQRLLLFRDAGFNLIRLPGTLTYEEEAFHQLCDELGILVWQDLMFANMDYPFGDADFRRAVYAEAQQQLSRLAPHPSTAVICGNSEIEQQVGMLGLDPALGQGPFFAEELPELVSANCPGVPYLPSAPTGGELPFRTRSGVSNYFGVGAYLRPLEDARRAGVLFASECLAFANVPEPETMNKLENPSSGALFPMSPDWKQGVPRDAGAGWDFEDVRDFYLRLLYNVEPLQLRYADLPRYWQLSRMVSGEVMAEVFKEWRRAASSCAGGVILWAADLRPGAGWGILDSHGWPKSAYWFLKRTLGSQTVWTTDEGLNGIDIHLANDSPRALQAWLRVALYRMAGPLVAESRVPVVIAPRGRTTCNVEQVLGRFVDASYAYRFGPPAHDLVSVSLHHEPEGDAFAKDFRFPLGRPSSAFPMAELGLTGESSRSASGKIRVLLRTCRFAYGVRVYASGFLPEDAYFGIEPGAEHRLELAPSQSDSPSPLQLTVSAVNAEGVIYIPVREDQ